MDVDASHDLSAPIDEGIEVVSDTDDIEILRCVFNIPWPIMQANLMNLLQSAALWTLRAPPWRSGRYFDARQEPGDY
jgi:hypothetical protein